MKKKSPELAFFLAAFIPFGAFYTSELVGIVTLLLQVVSGFVIGFSVGFDQLPEAIWFANLLIQPFTILWCVLVVKRRNELIESNQIISSGTENSFGLEAFGLSVLALFFALGITALVIQFNATVWIATDVLVFYALELIVVIGISALLYNGKGDIISVKNSIE